MKTNKVNPGQSTKVMCIAEGDPVPQNDEFHIVVKRNSKERQVQHEYFADINNNNRVYASYVISEAQQDMSFQCKVTTVAGTIEAKVNASLYSKLGPSCWHVHV